MTTTPEPKAAEQVIFATLLQTLGEPNDRVAHKIDQALKAAGLLVGAPCEAPTEEQIERAALEMHRCEWPGGYGWKTYLPLARAALAAVGVAPQEPSEAKQCGPCRRGQRGCCDGNEYVRCDDKHGALSPDREKLIAEKAEAWEEGVATALNHAKRGSDGISLKLVTFEGDAWPNPYRSAAALAAAPVLDETKRLDPEKVAEVLRREDWPDALWDDMSRPNRARNWNRHLDIGRRFCRAADSEECP